MARFFDLRQRVRQPEIMDQPGLDEALHLQALRGLARINFLSQSAGILWPAIRQMFPMVDGPLRLLDIATGGGDVPLHLWEKAQRTGYALQLSACDRSETALKLARQRASAKNVPITLFPWDVLSGPLPVKYDVVICSLFLHHLEEDQALKVLQYMAQAARHLVLINDLSRGVFGLVLAHVVTRLVSRSAMVRVDGPLSVRAAFTPEEILSLSRRAGLEGTTVRTHWPCRWLLSWRRTLVDVKTPEQEAAWRLLGQASWAG